MSGWLRVLGFGRSTRRAALVDDYLLRRAARHGNRPAIGALGETISYAELDRRVTKVANGLLAEGKPGDRIAILGRNSRELVELLFGCVRAGCVALPVNWRLAAPEIAFILEHSGATRIFTDAEFAAAANSAAKAIPLHLIDGDGPGDYAQWRDGQRNRKIATRGEPDDVVLQMYTSGTTGLPKGVQLTNANITASVPLFGAGPLALSPRDVVYAPAPIFHITGVGPVIQSIRSGARLVLTGGFVPEETVREMAHEQVSYTTMAPAMIHACLATEALAQCSLDALRIIVYGGSPIAESVLREAQERLGCEFAQCYGLTETTGPVTLLTPEDHAPGRDLLASCGRAVEGIDIMVVDAEGNRLPAGETGEVLIRGSIIMPGYASDLAATEATIVDRWLHSGDAGYLDAQGYLFIRDRVKDMIVSGGENIYPVEVEHALQSHPDIADVAVIGVPDEQWGEAVLALAIPRPGATPDAEAILQHCRERIAGYKCPKQIRFINAIPRNAAGKILRRELREPFWETADRKVG